MSDEFLGRRRQALEDSFFHARDNQLLEKLRNVIVEKEAAEGLAAASSITNSAVLSHLVSLGITSQTLTALSLVPLVAVAWADGRVQVEERAAILSAAGEVGIESGQPAYELLESWLSEEPNDELLASWKDYVAELAKSLDQAALSQVKQDVVGRARRVAESAGGVLGIGSISKAERTVLDELDQAFAT